MEKLVKSTEIEKKTEKEPLLLWVKLQTCLTGAILALMLVAAVFAAVQVNQVMTIFRGVDTEKINSTILSLQRAAEELEDVDAVAINQTVEALKSAAQNLADADIDAVNAGIEALTAAAENLQGLDIREVNALIQSLEAVSKQMEKTTSAFSKLFGK